MNLLIDCKNVKISNGQAGNIEVEIIEELAYPEQLDHYIDYLKERYGSDFLWAIKRRFDLQEME